MDFNKKSLILSGVIIIVIVLAAAAVVFKGPRDESVDNLPSGLRIQDETVGTGAEAVSGKIITVNYTGTLTNGNKFDSSYDRGTSFSFVLGAGQVIQGWEEGVAGMKVGGKRKLVIPPELGYGNQNVGNGLIPPNSTLIFEVELLDVQSPK